MKWTPQQGRRDEAEYGTQSLVCPVCGARFLIRREGYWQTAVPTAKGSMQAKRHRGTRVFCSNACKQKAYRARK